MVIMFCYCCEQETAFHESEEGLVCDCGYYQDSQASAAAELCCGATWHLMSAYKETAEIARQGGFTVPDVPRYFSPIVS
jgi:hypothetical protein